MSPLPRCPPRCAVRTAKAVFPGLAVLATLVALLLAGCDSGASSQDPDADRDFRQDMMSFVADLSAWAKDRNPDFIVIPQNGAQIYSEDFEFDAPINTAYFDAIDAIGQEDLRYGYEADNEATDPDVTAELEDFLDVYLAEGKVVLVTDYIDTGGGISSSQTANDAKGYLSFQGVRELDEIPSNPNPLNPYNYDGGLDDNDLTTAENFLYVLDPGGWNSRAQYLNALRNTNHDALIIDAFDNDQVALTPANVASLQTGFDSNVRQVIGYMSIGEAENFRYYWDSDWDNDRPAWLDKENKDFPGDFKVRYWYAEWQDIIFGDADSYLQKILDAGFDGVYLDIIDGFEYWEDKIGN